MDIDESNVLDYLRGLLDDDGYAPVETFFNKYSEDNRIYREGAESRIGEYAAAEEVMKADIQDLKARNYDLLMQVPASENEGDGVVVEDVDEDGTVYHIDNLFTDEKETNENGN